MQATATLGLETAMAMATVRELLWCLAHSKLTPLGLVPLLMPYIWTHHLTNALYTCLSHANIANDVHSGHKDIGCKCILVI